MADKDQLAAHLRGLGQEQLLRFWDELSDDHRQELARDIASVDLAAIRELVAGDDHAPDWQALAQQARSPRSIRLQATNNEFRPDEARRRGEEALRAGQVGMILVAGGQGTRLGFPHPKGLFPIGPVSQRTLFQVIVDRLRAVSELYGTAIPLYIMTSPVTHDATVSYFRDNHWLGLEEEGIHFFCQGTLPAVDRETGQVLLAEKGRLALSPDGHGGMLLALSKSGCLQDARQRGITLIFYGQVDNPLLQVCDPALLGYHLLAESEMTTQVIQKRFPLERVGNVVDIDGRTQIIEYSDLPNDAAERREPDGSLSLWAGNIAVHVFAVEFLSRTANDANSLPVHRAVKKVPCMDAEGQLLEPANPNAIKFERFIFDLLPKARRTLVVEIDPADGFAPVKNASGEKVDTPETAQQAMIQHDATLLRASGLVVEKGVPVEVNPRWAMTAAEAAGKAPRGLRITGPTYFA